LQIMTNRELIYIVREQKPLVFRADQTVRAACRAMWERRAGSVLVVDSRECLVGIFTGRDAVRLLAKEMKEEDAGGVPLARAMTREPVALTPRSRAIDALRAMSEGGFRHVPVTDDGKVLGVVSRGDFKGMEFEEYRWRKISQTRSAENRALREVVKGQKPLMLATDQTVADAARQMWKRKTGSALVVDQRQRLKGIFTGRDAVRVLAKAKHAAATRLEKAMTADPATVSADSHAIDALRAMNDGGFRHLPVVENGKILGIVSRNDFTGFELDRLEEEEHLKECIW
jgi:CBS domain-containing protein